MLLFLSFVSNIPHPFLNLSGNFTTGVAYKRFAYKRRANSNLIAERTKFLESKIMQLILELYG